MGINAKIGPYDAKCSDDRYYFVGEVMRPSYGYNIYCVHQALVSKATQRSVGVQTAFVTDKDGVIFGTHKNKEIPAAITAEFWELFYNVLHDKTSAFRFTAEMPRPLARRYVYAYKGCSYSDSKPQLGLRHLTVLEIVMEDKMSKKQLRATASAIGAIVTSVVLKSVFGFGDLAIFGLFLMAGLMGHGALIAYGMGTFSANMSGK